MKKHIFLTGEIQVGKSTIIRRFLLQSGLSADGFMTYCESDNGGNRSMYLSAYSTSICSDEMHLVTRNAGSQIIMTEDMISIFDVKGCEILNNSGKRELVIMDELGVLESKSVFFQQAVMRHISGNVPILGVIKPKRTEFLDTIRAHTHVEVREVTVENRTEVFAWLSKQYGFAMSL